MSNTSTVTPYTAPVETGPSCAERLAEAVKWLFTETEEDKAETERLAAVRRQERLDAAVPGDLAAVRLTSDSVTRSSLGLREPGSLVKTAERLGYRCVEPSGNNPTDNAPQLLTGPAGERLIIERAPAGLTLYTTGGSAQIERLVRQHTLDRAIAHLSERGMALRTHTLANGEVQILAREVASTPAQRGRNAEVKAEVRTDGTMRLDVDKVRGDRCVEIVRGLADAVGGAVAHMDKKDAYFDMPGEPTRTQVRPG